VTSAGITAGTTPTFSAQAATLGVRWSAGDAHGRATVFTDLRHLKVCDWKRDGYRVAIKWGIRVWLVGWRDDWKSLRAPQGGCESYTWDPGGKLYSRIVWASYCASRTRQTDAMWRAHVLPGRRGRSDLIQRPLRFSVEPWVVREVARFDLAVSIWVLDYNFG
jgi:hypothetical protein